METLLKKFTGKERTRERFKSEAQFGQIMTICSDAVLRPHSLQVRDAGSNPITGPTSL